MAFNILELPNELIANVLELVEDIPTLRSLATTCKRIQTLTEKRLYQDIFFRSVWQITNLGRCIGSRPQRGKSIRRIECRCHPKSWIQGFSDLSTLLSVSINVREFVFESPHCNDSFFESDDQFLRMQSDVFLPFTSALRSTPSRPLQHLQKLTIHMNGANSPYWTLNSSNNSILAHPTLKELTISCVNIHGDCTFGLPTGLHTPLSQLTLDECNISVEGIASLLALPKALSHLHLGENFYNLSQFPQAFDLSSNRLFQCQPQETIRALSQQSKSLVTLKYVTNETRYTSRMTKSKPPESGFAAFERLEKITLVGFCPNFGLAVCRGQPPPALKTLHFYGEASRLLETLSQRGPVSSDSTTYREQTLDLPFLQHTSAAPPHLENYIVTFDHYQTGWVTPATRIVHQPINYETTLVQSLKRSLHPYGISVSVYCKLPGKFIPPLLHGETDSLEKLLGQGDLDGNEWDSDYSDGEDIDDFDDDEDDDDNEENEDEFEIEVDEDFVGLIDGEVELMEDSDMND